MESKYELLLCVVNAGYSQNVMEAARTGAARREAASRSASRRAGSCLR